MSHSALQDWRPTLLEVMWQEASGTLGGGTVLLVVATSANLDSGLFLLCSSALSAAAGPRLDGVAS